MRFEKQISRTKDGARTLAHSTWEKVTGYLLAGFGLVASLAWNEAIKAIIEYLFPTAGEGIVAKIAYAILLTIVAVIITAVLVNVSKKRDKEEKKS